MPFSGNVCLMSYPFSPHEESAHGIGNYSYELTQHFSKLGLHPTVLSVGDIPRHLWQWPIMEMRFMHLLSSIQADVFHAVHPFGADTAALLRKRPLVTTIHDLLPTFFKTKFSGFRVPQVGYVYNEISMRRLSKTDAIIVPFNITKEWLVDYYGIASEKIRVVNLGVDHSLFHPATNRHDKEKKILYVGELLRMKGVETLLRAYTVVATRIKDTELIIGGKGRDFRHFSNLARSLGLRVAFIGFVSYRDLPRRYAEADVFVWPSQFGFGLTALQAMACGTPVIASRCMDMSEFLTGAGILVKPNDHIALANAIINVISSAELHRELSSAGVQRARQYSWEKTAKETIAIYEEVSRR